MKPHRFGVRGMKRGQHKARAIYYWTLQFAFERPASFDS